MRKKLSIIFTTLVLLKLTTACWLTCECPTPMNVEITFNSIITGAPSNSWNYNEETTNNEENVRFVAELSDTSEYSKEYSLMAFKKKHSPNLFIKTASALEPCDCVFFHYKFKQIASISITTLYNYNEEYPALSDLTSEFLAIDQSYISKGLYITIEEAINNYNNQEFSWGPTSQFNFYSRAKTNADSCRFEIAFNFDDNTCLCDTTHLIKIVR